MAYLNFTEALMEAKRRAQLQGRPLSSQETTGIVEAQAKTAAEKLLQEKQLGLQEKSVGLQESSLAEQTRQFNEQLAQRKYETEKELEAAKEATKAEAYGTAGSIGGAVIGTALLPGVGTVLGSVGGGSVGKILSGCIIISSCTSPNSYEVNLARAYRDQFMDETMLFGYYFLCGLIVPLIQKSEAIRMIFYKGLVKRLVDYGEMRLGEKKKCKFLSRVISIGFLGVCSTLGRLGNMVLGVCHE